MKLCALLLPCFALCASHASARASNEMFDFETLRYRAKMLAARAYAPRATTVPEALRKLSYDEYRLITFSGDQAWWRRDGLPYQLQFFHPGFVHQKSVQVSELNGRTVTPVKFSRDMFNYGGLKVGGGLPDTVGFAGFKVLGSLNLPADELVSFVGASYFRALCLKTVYGLSARGLAINTTEPEGEEFPVFEEFWIERPATGAKQCVIYALMDSASVAGAYRFTVTPGADTVMQVKAVVYCRKNPKVLGLAPLTSMFWHGENSGTNHGDFRPEVHDSDGLMVFNGANEWLWRPLSNPKATRVSAFSDDNPRGFGLIQRDRKYESYQDLEAHYHLRPSAWVEPVGNWGAGPFVWTSCRQRTRPTTTSLRFGCPNDCRRRDRQSSSNTSCTGIPTRSSRLRGLWRRPGLVTRKPMSPNCGDLWSISMGRICGSRNPIRRSSLK